MQCPQAFSFLQEVKVMMSHEQNKNETEMLHLKRDKSLTLEFSKANKAEVLENSYT